MFGFSSTRCEHAQFHQPTGTCTEINSRSVPSAVPYFKSFPKCKRKSVICLSITPSATQNPRRLILTDIGRRPVGEFVCCFSSNSRRARRQRFQQTHSTLLVNFVRDRLESVQCHAVTLLATLQRQSQVFGALFQYLFYTSKLQWTVNSDHDRVHKSPNVAWWYAQLTARRHVRMIVQRLHHDIYPCSLRSSHASFNLVYGYVTMTDFKDNSTIQRIVQEKIHIQVLPRGRQRDSKGIYGTVPVNAWQTLWQNFIIYRLENTQNQIIVKK